MLQANKKYDVVIIGSGMAGLACGAILSKEGRSICIIEKNEQIGGALQTFQRDRVKFDTGVHYLGGLSRGQNLYQLFNYLGIIDRLELQKMEEDGFDVILFKDDEKEYPYGMGYENFIRIMGEKFPDDGEAIVEYCNEIKRICNSIPLYNLRKGDAYEDVEVFSRSAKGFLDELTENEKLKNVLAGTNLLYAGVGDKTPLYIHALVVNSYIESSWKCADGGDQIAKLLAREIKSRGGDILRKKRVTKIHVEGEKAEYVIFEDGTKIYADTFISNIHPVKTLEMTDTDRIRSVYRERVKGLENSLSAFVIYAVMKPGSWKCRNRNYYYFDECDVWKPVDYTEETWPYTYAMYEGVPERQNEYAEAITIMTYMRYEEVKQWESTFNTTVNENERGGGYAEFKRRKAEKLLDTVGIKFPNFRDNIQLYYTSTPLSYRDYIGTSDGSMYGIARDFNDPLRTSVSPNTKIPNLLLTGQNVNLHGVLGVTVSAVRTCAILLGKDYLLDKIAEANEAAV